jgi:hypothetical protein
VPCGSPIRRGLPACSSLCSCAGASGGLPVGVGESPGSGRLRSQLPGRAIPCVRLQCTGSRLRLRRTCRPARSLVENPSLRSVMLGRVTRRCDPSGRGPSLLAPGGRCAGTPHLGEKSLRALLTRSWNRETASPLRSHSLPLQAASPTRHPTHRSVRCGSRATPLLANGRMRSHNLGSLCSRVQTSVDWISVAEGREGAHGIAPLR